jgi:hypothetical protein
VELTVSIFPIASFGCCLGSLLVDIVCTAFVENGKPNLQTVAPATFACDPRPFAAARSPLANRKLLCHYAMALGTIDIHATKACRLRRGAAHGSTNSQQDARASCGVSFAGSALAMTFVDIR